MTHLDIEKEREAMLAADREQGGELQLVPESMLWIALQGWLAARRASQSPVLPDEELDAINLREHPEGRCTTRSLRELGRAIEAEVASRCRAQGGNTQPNGDGRASLQADEGKGLPELHDAQIRFVLGEWRATSGIHHSVGKSPQEAYERLKQYVAAITAKEGK